MLIIDWIKKINKFLAGILNIILLSIIYYIGGGISFIFYKLSKKLKKKSSHWTDEIPEKSDYRRQI